MNKRGKGVSPVVATTIIIAITLAVGFAVFSFVNGEAAAASRAMGESTASFTNQLKERFVITNAAFNYDGSTGLPSNGKITVWFYNNGAINTKIIQVFIDTDPTMPNPKSFTTPLSLPKSSIAFLTIPYSGGAVPPGTYYMKAVGEFGNVAFYYQKA